MNVLTQLLIVHVIVAVLGGHDEARRQGYRIFLGQLVGEKTDGERRVIKRDIVRKKDSR